MAPPVTLIEYLKHAPRQVLEAFNARKGLARRRARNGFARFKGEEPHPGAHAGVKRWMRYHRRTI